MLNVTVVQLPRTMDHLAVLFDLLLRQRRAAFDETMWRDRHDVRRTVRKPNARTGKRYLHHVLREVTRRMQHVLVCGGDVATGRVVVRAKVSGDATTFSSSKQQRQIDLPLMIDDRLCSLDHHFKLQTTFLKTYLLLEPLEQRSECRDLFGNRDLRQCDDEVVRQTTAAQINQRRDKNIECAKTSCPQFFIERLDPDANERR